MPELRAGPWLDQGGRLTPRALRALRPLLAAERPGWNPAGRFDVVERQFVFSKSGPGERHSPGSRTEHRTGAVFRSCVPSAARNGRASTARLQMASGVSHGRNIRQGRPTEPGHPGQDRREAGVALCAGVAAGHAAAIVRSVAAAGSDRKNPTHAPLPAVENAGSTATARPTLLRFAAQAKLR